MRAILYATLGKAEIAAKLGPILGSDLKVVDNEAELAAEISEAEALFTGDMLFSPALAELLRTRAKRLKWVQILTAGYENIAQRGVPAGVTVTNAGDALAPAVGLHAVTLLLALQRQIPTFLKNQTRNVWDRGNVRAMVSPHGSVVAVLGFGHIGREIGRIMRALGAHVLGVTRSGKPNDIAHEMVSTGSLHDTLRRADAIMIALAMDPSTQGLIGAREFGLCKRSAFLVNIARGGIVDSMALAQALAEGQIAGAGLDVTDPEPLPADHPLWAAPNLVISPHCAGAGRLTTERLAATAADNLQRAQRGEALENVVKL